MNKFERYNKACEAILEAGHEASIIQQGDDDIGIWIHAWSEDLSDSREFRIHDEEVNYWSNHYDEMMQRRQPTKLVS